MTTRTSGTSPDKRRKYDEAFKAEALRLASESRSTQRRALVVRRPPAGLVVHSDQVGLPHQNRMLAFARRFSAGTLAAGFVTGL